MRADLRNLYSKEPRFDAAQIARALPCRKAIPMRPSPLRTPSVLREAIIRPQSVHRQRPKIDRDILPVFVALWVASAIRLAIALMHHETFGTELTLAFITVVLVPVLLFSSVFERHSGRGSSGESAH